MKLPIITKLLQCRGRRRLRRVMRGYRFLKRGNQLDRIKAVKELLTNTKLNQCEHRVSKFIFGAGLKDAELIIRQYLLIRFGGMSFNQALLYALGRHDADVVHPLPSKWREVLRQQGFKVAEVRSALMWNAYVILFLAYGIVKITRQLVSSINEIILIRHESLGRYAYFGSLISGNLPQPNKDGRSHDIITWYQQWPERIDELNALCHSVRGAASRPVQGVPVVPISSAIPPLPKIAALVRFIGWSVAASTVAIFDILRGRWWHALMLGEASYSAAIRAHTPNNLARDYLFHNSNWIYRPLWTYEAEKHGSRIIFYFYSLHDDEFVRPGVYLPLLQGWQTMNWPRYLVWDEYQENLVRLGAGNSANITIVGPIWFHTSKEELKELPLKTFAVFDVQPVRDSFYQILGRSFEYYTPRSSIRFVSDIHKVINEYNGTIVLKQKRKIDKLAHPNYRLFIEQLDKLPNIIIVNPDISASRLIENCAAVISRPFTSTALIARELGKPSIYFDPAGVIQKNDRGAHGIQVVSDVEELREWMASVFNEIEIKSMQKGIPTKTGYTYLKCN